jgi:penicillin-binding protein 1A
MKKQRFSLKKLIIYFTVSFILTGLCLYLLTWSEILGDLPDHETLKSVQNPIATEVYAKDGGLIGKYFYENRTHVDFGNIPVHFVDALISTEDVRFHKHHGIDLRSIARVMIKGVLLMDRSAGGGSTITQQLAKNIYPRKNYLVLELVINKIREGIIASRIEKVYSKEEILNLYLNTVSFGEQAFGIGTASRRFFNKSPNELKPEESALLVGILKAPSYYSPRRFPERAQTRRNVVIHQMIKYGYGEAEALEPLKKLPVKLVYKRYNKSESLNAYFLDQLKNDVISWIDANPGKDGSGSSYNLYTDGLKIYTTLDSRLQQIAENAVKKQMKNVQAAFDAQWKGRGDWETNAWISKTASQSQEFARLKNNGLEEKEIMTRLQEEKSMKLFSWDGGAEVKKSTIDSILYYKRMLQAGFFAVDHLTGEIKVWIGGINYKHFKYDHILARRQVGSTFKPFVYAAALEKGIDPCQYYDNTRLVFKDYNDWSPKNAKDEYGGSYSMAGGLAHSVNTVSVQVMMDAGIKESATMARRMGIESAFSEVPSIALGTPSLSLFEMTKAYACIANGGFPVNPYYLEKIEDRHGNVLVEFDHQGIGAEPVIEEETRDILVQMLREVTDNGTAKAIKTRFGLEADIAGKTGTTQNQSDGWFMGMTANLVAGAWVGADDPRVHFKTLYSGQGARTALPIWGEFYARTLKHPVFSHWVDDRISMTIDSFYLDWHCPAYSDLNAEEMNEDRLVFDADDFLTALERDPEHVLDAIGSFLDNLFSNKNKTNAGLEEQIAVLMRDMEIQIKRKEERMLRQERSAEEIEKVIDRIKERTRKKIRKLRAQKKDA